MGQLQNDCYCLQPCARKTAGSLSRLIAGFAKTENAHPCVVFGRVRLAGISKLVLSGDQLTEYEFMLHQ